MAIFPEGTRQPVDKLGRFQVGGAMIAIRSKSKVVPVAHNAGLFWPKNSFIKHPGVIDIVIGPAFSSVDKKTRVLNQKVEAWIQTTINTLPKER